MLCGVGAAALIGLGATSTAQAAPAAAPVAEGHDTQLSEVVVSAARTEVGAVVSDIAPELQLGSEDIEAYGVSTVAQLLNELAPQTQSDRGRGGEAPVVLLNGKPISGMNEIRDIPTEAILRVDVLPEEVSLKYGYSANQRVVNIVLRPAFHALTAELQASAPTEGGQATGNAEANQFKVLGDNRLNLNLKYEANSALTENERDLTPLTAGQPFDLAGNVTAPGGGTIPALSALVGRPVTIAGVPGVASTRAPTLADFAPTAGVQNPGDNGRYRTLSPATQSVSANGVLSRVILGGVSATVNATLSANSSRSLQGLPGVSLLVPGADPFSPFGSSVLVNRSLDAYGPLRQSTDGWTGHLGVGFNRTFGLWRVNLTGNYDHVESRVSSDTGLDVSGVQALLDAASPSLNPFGPLPGALVTAQAPNKTQSKQDTANFRLLVNGSLFRLPAGQVTTSFRGSGSLGAFDTRSQRFGAIQDIALTRDTLNGQVSIDAPIASRRNKVLPFLGELSANANAALDHVSGFGTLQALGYGLTWTPMTGVSLIFSHTRDQTAPTVQQLGNPVLITPGVRLFDYVTGQTVEVDKITGGAALRADHRDVLKLGLTLKPFPAQDLTFTANYISSRIENPIATFPAATADIEAAFPDRFLRDAAGDLIQVDYRPVNFARQDHKELRWGVNFIHRLGAAPPPPPPQANRRALLAGNAPRPGQGAQGPQDGAGQPPPPGPDGAQPAPTDAGPNGRGGPGGGAGAPPGGGAGGQRAFGGGGGGGGARGGGGGGGGRGGGGGGGQGDAQAAQIQLALYHTMVFEDRILIRPGGPLLDLLNGAAAGGGGGTARHQLQAQAGLTLKGFGARLTGTWQSGTTVDGGAASTTGPLTFSSLAVVNFRLFANLGTMPSVVAGRPWLRGSRLTLTFNNLFNTRQQVRDATGATPLSYQPAYLDPEGRTVHLEFRKLFS